MMKTISLATAVLVSSAMLSGAMAADMAPHAYTKAPAMVSPATNWSGFYAGVNVGYEWGNGNTDFSFLPTPAIFEVANTSVGAKSNGVIGGAQIGYNWQMGSLVTGLEADIQGSGIKGSARSSFFNADVGFVVPGEFLSSTQRLSWFGTVRARLGVTVTPALLLYGTGGLAFGQVENTSDTFFQTDLHFPASIDKTKASWAAGAGAEWMFARSWSAKVEYLHVDLGSVSTVVGVAPTHFLIPPADQVNYTWRNQENIVRAGVNYHFN
jgi:outer membrane immunogenic protein